MDLTEYRNSEPEQARIADLMRLVPDKLDHILDIGARDGYLAVTLTQKAQHVTALDLSKPEIEHERITCVKGNAAALTFADRSIDLVFCAEVLEHIPPEILPQACAELGRVASRYVVIGVPYKQDIRFGRTTCQHCGQKNPPWGHVNSFDSPRLQALFPDYRAVQTSFVGETREGTNSLACWMMDMAGNPYGTYSQQEPCIQCGAVLVRPSQRTLWQKVLTRVAATLNDVQRAVTPARGNWVHVLFERKPNTERL